MPKSNYTEQTVVGHFTLDDLVEVGEVENVIYDETDEAEE